MGRGFSKMEHKEGVWTQEEDVLEGWAKLHKEGPVYQRLPIVQIMLVDQGGWNRMPSNEGEEEKYLQDVDGKKVPLKDLDIGGNIMLMRMFKK